MFFSAEKLYFNRVFGLFLILFLAALAAGVQAQARKFAPGQDKNKVEKQDKNQDKNSKKTTGGSKAELAREAENKKQAQERERAAESRRDEARAAELARRRAAWKPPPPRYERGYGWMFGQHILQADEGCDFDFLERSFGAPVAEPDIY